ncbi:hypothetical protein NDU88_000210 [Pleurodeles waltl]|uniref:Uncharacterized protein n=1 Tax=Pleurodeles waltl TaxID=8319 RepID=A0AAV7UQE9_PLEWA|nr:hypothetical protein NDU88_000210 [Pleurodeles waltl]
MAAAGRGSSAEIAVRSGCREVERGGRTHALGVSRVPKATVSCGGQMGAFDVSARTARRARAHKRGVQQALLAL